MAPATQQQAHHMVLQVWRLPQIRSVGDAVAAAIDPTTDRERTTGRRVDRVFCREMRLPYGWWAALWCGLRKCWPLRHHYHLLPAYHLINLLHKTKNDAHTLTGTTKTPLSSQKLWNVVAPGCFPIGLWIAVQSRGQHWERTKMQNENGGTSEHQITNKSHDVWELPC